MTIWTTFAAVRAELVDLLNAQPALAGDVLDGVPSASAEDVFGPRGEGVSVWLDNATTEVAIDPRALGALRIGETWTQPIIVQCVARDSGPGPREAESQLVDRISAVMDVVYDNGDVLTLTGVTGWTTRARFVGMSIQSAPMEHGGYSALASIDLQVEATRC
jgi:hypothetical protein